jgi:histidine ammonia-lyase
MNEHIISQEHIDLALIDNILSGNTKLKLSEKASKNIVNCRTYLDNKLQQEEKAIYGINTGFGALHDKKISKENLSDLQKNLVMSHACGQGDEVPDEIVRLMLFLKIQSLSYGNSGVQIETVQRLIDFFNLELYPVVYQQGSLGASGDLAPLAHLSLALIGMGEVNYQQERFKTDILYQKLGLDAVSLKSKEGLALLNGTQFMSAYGVYNICKMAKLSELADVIAAISLDAFDGRIEPFHERIHSIRKHQGQMIAARRISTLLEGSELIQQEKKHVQDPYSFRCIPQVHGASKDTIIYVSRVFENEINSVTDNPTIFPDEDLIISAGNFHGQPLALAADFLAIAAAELGSISERRTYQLIAGKRGLPSFLVANPGLNSGFMIPQYTAASIVSQNKQLCSPASVDSMESSQEQEDHVSMGANAATKLYKVVENTEKVLAIELFNAAQALDFRKPRKTSKTLSEFVERYREHVPFIENDQCMYDKINASVEFLRNEQQNMEVVIEKE